MDERRRAERRPIEIPVEFNGGTGLTRDVSTSGVYFTATHPIHLPQEFPIILIFHKDLDVPVRLSCHASLVRVSIDGEEVGVAVRIDSFGQRGNA
jgi:hypothetical protein